MNCKKRKKLLMVGAGIEQVLAIKQAKDLGMYVVVCDGNPNAPGLKEGDVGVVIDIRNPDKLCNLAEKHRVDGVFCHAVEIPDVIAEVAERLRLPGLKREVAERATNKTKRISYLAGHGIPCARFAIVVDGGELQEKGEKFGFPLVMKPVDNAGSRGVSVVETPKQLFSAYDTATKYSSVKTVLLEEVMSGPEISTESVVCNGRIITFAFADRNYASNGFFHPYFVEDGINFPTILSKNDQDRVYDLVAKTIECLGIDFGAAKGDVIIDKGIPKIIEMAARTSGGWFGSGSIPIATGSNMFKPLLEMAVGDDPDLGALTATRRLGCAQRYVIPTEAGIVEKISGVEEALRMPGVAMHTMFLPDAGMAVRKATNNAERFGQIICTGDTRGEAIERCEAAISKIRLHLKRPKAS